MENKITNEDILEPEMLEKCFKTYWTLFVVFMKISFVTFGGGAAVIPFIDRECVQKRGWISDKDLLEIVAIANSLPGASMIQMAGLVGYRKAGKRGAVAATLGIALVVPIIFFAFMSFADLVDKDLMKQIKIFVMPVIAAMMFALIIKLWKGSKNKIDQRWAWILFGISAILYFVFENIFPLVASAIMIGGVLATALFYVLLEKAKKHDHTDGGIK